jgi:tRNA A37 threonylcarbamoyladenosine synthetase subunit TsaC/SUA5/YrdC
MTSAVIAQPEREESLVKTTRSCGQKLLAGVIAKAMEALRRGLVAFPTDTLYALGADAWPRARSSVSSRSRGAREASP